MRIRFFCFLGLGYGKGDPEKPRDRARYRFPHHSVRAPPSRRHCHMVTTRAAARMAGPSAATAAPAIVRDGADASPLLGGLMVEWSDVFREEVLKKWLDPMDLAMLARACWKCGEAVASAGIVRAGDTAEEPFKLLAFFASGELLAWAKANRCLWGRGVCSLAAKHGQVEALQWAREHDCAWDTVTCAIAARHGQLEALVWAREHGCPWAESTTQSAAWGGHLNVLQWAREHDAPWNQGTCHYATEGGHLEMLQWARENGCPCPDINILVGLAPRSGNVEMMTWFHEQGCQLVGFLCVMAAEYGRLEVLIWLREHGCPAVLDACIEIASHRGHDEVVEWLGQFTDETWHTTTN